MRNFKKVLALLLATLMVSAMAFSAFAVKITITRDNSYDGNGKAAESGNEYTAYLIFTAVPANGSGSFTGGGSGSYWYGSGTGSGSNMETNHTNVAYTATSTVAAKLGHWVAAVGTPGESGYVAAHWERASGNEWFDLTPIAGTETYSVEWVGGSDNNGAKIRAAADWLLAHVVEGSGTSLAFSGGKWSADVDPGYYVIKGAVGNNLVAATTDIIINEKNVYPSIDKTQADEDGAGSGTKDNNDRNVAVGDTLYYDVKVSIPATAKVGEKILVWDTPTAGLTYDNNVAVTKNEGTANVEILTTAHGQYVSGSAWSAIITVTENSKGKDVVFTFTMKVNDSAIVDTGKKNEVELKYGNGSGTGSDYTWNFDSEPDEVEYKTYYAGIFKFDGDDSGTWLEGVKFNLFENNQPFPVRKSGSYYIPDPTGSGSEIVTDGSGTIHIRGLDNDKTYTVTETYTLPGYNLLDHDVTLTLKEDFTSKTTYTPVESGTTLNSSATYYTKNGTEYTAHTGLSGTAPNATYYTATTTTSGSYNSAVKQSWEDKIENKKGTLLPSTGGIGTTIFYIVGGLLAVGAGIVLVSKKRMGKEEN